MKTLLIISPLAPAGESVQSAHGSDFRVIGARDLEEARPLLGRAEAVVYQGCGLNEADLGLAVECLIAVHGGPGTAGTDLEAARALGILLSSEPDIWTADYAALAMKAILAAAARSGIGTPGQRPPRAGLIGLGEVGRAVAEGLIKLGWSVWAHDPFAPPSQFDFSCAQKAELNDLLGSCEVISLHRPADASGVPAIGAAQLAYMKPGAALVNTSAAALVDFAEVVVGLRSGRINSAALTRIGAKSTDTGDLETGGRLTWLDTNFGADPLPARRALNAATDTALRALNGEVPEHLLIDPPLPRLLVRANGNG